MAAKAGIEPPIGVTLFPFSKREPFATRHSSAEKLDTHTEAVTILWFSQTIRLGVSSESILAAKKVDVRSL